MYSHEGAGGTTMEREGSRHELPDLARLTLEKGRELDADDLHDDDAWLVASKEGRIEEVGTLGEGSGGAVTKCRLKGGKTIFALKVSCSACWKSMD
jgi:mitogen-activated protein kinase kinase